MQVRPVERPVLPILPITSPSLDAVSDVYEYRTHMRIVGFGPVGMTDDDIFAVAARVVIARNRNDAVARGPNRIAVAASPNKPRCPARYGNCNPRSASGCRNTRNAPLIRPREG